MKIFPSILIAATASFAAAESDTIKNVFIKERRFMLFNSRQLEGKCSSICRDDKDDAGDTREPTVSPTLFPTDKPTTLAPTSGTSVTASSSTSAHGSTASPTESPTLATGSPTVASTNKPTNAPTKKPTKAPTDAPTKKPTKKPTDAPTKKPTKAPTDAPTKKPTKAPTKKPTKEPTDAPTKKPTKKPTDAPTKKPTKKPTPAPTKAPTNKPTIQITDPPVSFSSHECVWPKGRYSAITKGDMISGAKNVYHSLAVGGKLKNPANSNIVVGGTVYHVGGYQGSFNFNGGVEQVSDLAEIPVDYAHYEWLAKNLKNSNINGKKVIVKTTGKDGSRNGCYSTADFNGSEAQGEDNGNTLVVFNTSDDICLTKTAYGRQFGPSVLAPFSKVTLTDSGFLDGVVIAKEFTTVKGSDKGSEQQLHGDTYTGPLECIEAPEPTGKPTAAPEPEPTKNPVAEPEDDGICDCEDGNDADSTWRCGRNIYMCPSIEKVCDKQPRSASKFFVLTQDQCDEMKQISIGDNCIALPQYGTKNNKQMGSRVCYNKGEHGMKNEKNKCMFCEDSIVPTLERRALSSLENPMTTVGSFS